MAAKAIHQRVTWEPATDPNAIIRSSIGGYPILPTGEPWPLCSEDGCGERLALFLQFDVAEGFGLPFASGSSFSVFQCIKHDDPFEALDTKSPKGPGDRLPDKYWEHANYALFFSAPDGQRQLAERDPYLGYSGLVFTPEAEPRPGSVEALNYGNVKVGGAPFWVQEPTIWSCSCGSEMAFLCSMPSNLQYPRVEGSPRQPNGRADTYFLFLGLSTYIFACGARCHPRAVVAVRQN